MSYKEPPCIALEEVAPDKQEIATTRSFGHPITELNDLREAVTEFATRAAQKLRSAGLATDASGFIQITS